MTAATDGLDRLLARVAAGPGGCVLFTGPLDRGYARVYHDGRRIPGHRLTYERMVGPVPPGLVLDHLCRVRHCVNPAHLEPVTPSENVRRGALPALNRAKLLRPTCKRGHVYERDGFYRNGNRRNCLPCKRAGYQAKKAATA